MKLIVGLGNPGKEYIHTRHNVGFEVLDVLQKQWAFPEFRPDGKLKAEVSKGTVTIISSKEPSSFTAALNSWVGDETTLLLAKPTTFMNLSGQAVLLLLSFYKLEPKDLLVIFDDFDLPIGTVRFRENGSAGTHNGMKSIVELLGTTEFARIKIGIKPEHPVGDLSGYVLGRMGEEEREIVKTLYM